MYNFFLRFFLFSITLCVSVLNAHETFDCLATHKHHSQPVNFLGPVVQFTLTPCPVTDSTAISFIGEAGSKVYRLGGTLGVISGENRFKLSIEHLGQDLEYRFSTGKIRRWVHQYAIGGVYQHILCNRWIESIDFEMSYSRAMNQNLRPVVCPQKDPTNITTLYRTIAGGRNAHASAGLTLSPWKCATLSLSADYDYARYVHRFKCDKIYSGFGGTARLNQLLPCNLYFNVAGEFRQPFNYYEASFGWGKGFDYTFVNVKLYGSYTQGMNRQPSIGTVGLSFDLAFGAGPLFRSCDSPKLYVTPSSCGNCCCGPCYVIDPCLLAWMASPAVYMPAVLTDPSETLVTTVIPTPPPPPPPCNPPVLIQSLPSQVNFTNPGDVFNAAAYFSSPTPMTFSLSPPTPSFTINPNTGVVTYTGTLPNPNPLQVFITATNACGTATAQTSFFVGGCTPQSCVDQGFDCGIHDNGCGQPIDCGNCTLPETCGGGGVPGVCGTGCTPQSCVDQGFDCGIHDNGCGVPIDCGTCVLPQTCGGGGVPGVCGCTSQTCTAQGFDCGIHDDGCGQLVDCGICSLPQTCGGGGVPGICGCTPQSCVDQGFDCGIHDNGCGVPIDCGTCVLPQTCGGGGTPGICGCTPQSCVDQGFDCGIHDNGCGVPIDCGTCVLPQTCGGGGTPGICGCIPQSCPQLGFNCGIHDNGCGVPIDCGTCILPQTCGGGGTPGICGN